MSNFETNYDMQCFFSTGLESFKRFQSSILSFGQSGASAQSGHRSNGNFPRLGNENLRKIFIQILEREIRKGVKMCSFYNFLFGKYSIQFFKYEIHVFPLGKIPIWEFSIGMTSRTICHFSGRILGQVP